MTSRHLILAATLGLAVMAPGGAVMSEVGEKVLLNNEHVAVIEYAFPPGFRGEEHAAVAHEFAYVLDGELVVVTRGLGRRVVRRGELEWALKGTVHYSLNEARRPARVLVVLLKER